MDGSLDAWALAAYVKPDAADNGSRESLAAGHLRQAESSQTIRLPGDQMATRYSKGAQRKVRKVMDARKRGTLRSGSGAKVKSRKQAIAIGLSEARRTGSRVPKKGTAHKKATGKRASR